MKVRIIGNVEHDGVLLTKHEVYNLEEGAAKALIASKDAVAVGEDYPEKKVEKYTPMKVRKDADSGMTVPGEKVAATESNPNPSATVKAVEPKQPSVKGGEDGEQEQVEKGKEEKKEKIGKNGA